MSAITFAHRSVSSDGHHWLQPQVSGSLYALIIASTLFGIYTVVFSASTYVLLSKKQKSKQTWILFVTILFMYLVSTIHIIATAKYSRDSLVSSIRTDKQPNSAPQIGFFDQDVMAAGPFITTILSDSIVVWRAWVLWSRRRFVLLIPGILLPCSLGFTIISAIQPGASAPDNVGLQLLGSYSTSAYCSCVALVNMWSTGLVGWKAWKYRRNIREHITIGNSSSQVERVLVMLVESGSIYCTFTITLALITWLPAARQRVFYIFIPISVQISGIYPTVIIILIALQKTHCDRQFTYGTPLSLVFAPTPGRADVHSVSTNNTVLDLRPTVDGGDSGFSDTPSLISGSDSSDCISVDVTDISKSGDEETTEEYYAGRHL